MVNEKMYDSRAFSVAKSCTGKVVIVCAISTNSELHSSMLDLKSSCHPKQLCTHTLLLKIVPKVTVADIFMYAIIIILLSFKLVGNLTQVNGSRKIAIFHKLSTI